VIDFKISTRGSGGSRARAQSFSLEPVLNFFEK